jgi:hypothetical protein
MSTAFLFSLPRLPTAPLRPMESIVVIVAERWPGAVAHWRLRLV